MQSYIDHIDGLGGSGIDRRCGKMPHMICLYNQELEIWIDVHVVFR